MPADSPVQMYLYMPSLAMPYCEVETVTITQSFLVQLHVLYMLSTVAEQGPPQVT